MSEIISNQRLSDLDKISASTELTDDTLTLVSIPNSSELYDSHCADLTQLGAHFDTYIGKQAGQVDNPWESDDDTTVVPTVASEEIKELAKITSTNATKIEENQTAIEKIESAAFGITESSGSFPETNLVAQIENNGTLISNLRTDFNKLNSTVTDSKTGINVQLATKDRICTSYAESTEENPIVISKDGTVLELKYYVPYIDGFTYPVGVPENLIFSIDRTGGVAFQVDIANTNYLDPDETSKKPYVIIRIYPINTTRTDLPAKAYICCRMIEKRNLKVTQHMVATVGT